MAITAGICHTFKQEVLVGTHNFTAAADIMKMALMTSASTNGPTTDHYSGGTINISGEVAAAGGYASGGNTLTNLTPVLNANEGCASFATTLWSTSTITANGAMIYNSSKANRSVAILAFGGDKISSAGDFTVTFPAQTGTNAIIRIT